MSDSDSGQASMEVTHKLQEGENISNLPDILPIDRPASSPQSCLTRPGPDLTGQMESKAISMASNECSSARYSPAEASPAKPDVAPSSTLEERFDQSPATSQIESATDSLKSPEPSLISISNSPPWVSMLSSTTFGCSDSVKDFPAVLSYKGVSVTLENNGIWSQFSKLGTEMILTKQGRRMFPYCRYRISGLDPDRMYSLVLSIVPSAQYRYRWNASKWEVHGPTEHQPQRLIRAFPHHYSPCLGSEWMNCLVSFYKLKLTNCFQDQDGHMILHSMHRYIPRLHVIPILDGEPPSADRPMVMGPESITFTFPQTEFMAVTTYQNFRITQLKINHNPFAKGFREDGNNPRLNRVLPPAARTETRTEVLTLAEPIYQPQEVTDLSAKSQGPSAPSTNAQETRLVLKPIMSKTSGNGDRYVPCMRGKHALGDILLIQNQSDVEPKKGGPIGTITENSGSMIPPKSRSNNCSSSKAAPGTSTRFYRRRTMKKRRNLHLKRSWKRAAITPKETNSQSLKVAMEPELDDIEGLLFVSFTSKEALEVHFKDKFVDDSSSEPPVTLPEPMETKQSEVFCDGSLEETQETVEEKTARLASLLLEDLSKLKQRQVIHPVLQEVGLKLSSLDPTSPVDLKYLGVCLPQPPSSLHSQGSAAAKSPADEELPFISRTGKTRDVTKIKGWRNKFTKNPETPTSNSEGLPKNLSAFCSNMLDEYLESEAQQISERAAAFSTLPEDAVSYQLPEKGSSYVKTLDSALKHRNASSNASVGTNKPCPLSRKTLPNSSPAANPNSGTTPKTSDPDGSAGRSYANGNSQRLPISQPGATQRPMLGFSPSQGPSHKTAGFSRFQLKLMEMETAALNQNLSKTHLTPERLSSALSVIMSKESMPSEIPFQDVTVGPHCGQEFCRLGCVCHSLQQHSAVSNHCRQPDCMFACSCSKYMEQWAQPHFVGKLWNRSVLDEDLEPLYTPKTARKVQKTWTYCPAPPIREEDKDPVYKYLESKMTCARVREYNSLPPPVMTLHTALSQQDNATQNADKQESIVEATDPKPETPLDTTAVGRKVKKQIQIQSLCQWKKDGKMVLKGLCERLNQDRLHQRFCIGPYCVHPVSRLVLKKPNVTLITYRMQISKAKKGSSCKEESVEGEKCDDGRVDGHAKEEVAEERLNGTTPTGRLRAQKKPSGCKASGLIQVNDKYYNHATVLLGRMGSLHPANRLAAHVTGRLQVDKKPEKKLSKNTANTPQPLHLKAANAFIPLAMDQKTIQHPKADLLKPNSLSNIPNNMAQDSQKSQCPSPSAQLFIPVQPNIHSSSTSSPVSLTVSPSLKSPSFLAESGTYSFRICPPSTQAGGGQQPPGVALPGGFTLIQLPKPGAEGATEQARSANSASNDSSENKGRAPNLNQLMECVGFDTFSKVRNLLSSNVLDADPSSGRPSEEKMESEGNSEEDELLQTDSQYFDMSPEELSSSDFSDDDEYEEENEMVDIETVDGKQVESISKLQEQASVGLQQSRDSADGYTHVKELNEPAEMNAEHQNKRVRRTHSILEKQRRCEQRVLFDRLQSLLKLDHRSSRLHVLEVALKEIKNLLKASWCLETERRRLTRDQSVLLKRLSVLAGKPENLIQKKLKEIFERQKQRERNMKWKPFFSHLLQSKAALLQATASSPDSESSSPPQHDLSPEVQTNQSDTAKKTFQMLLSMFHSSKKMEKTPEQLAGDKRLQSQPKVLQTGVQRKKPGASKHPPSQLDGNQKSSGNSGQSTGAASGTTDQQLLDTNNPGSSGVVKRTIVVPSRPFAVPLIRSKTGRLILPSSLKPLGNGGYTLMLMRSKRAIPAYQPSSSATAEPLRPNPSKRSENSTSSSKQPQEARSVTMDESEPSDSLPKSSGVTPLVNLLGPQENQEGSLPFLINVSTAGLCLKPVGQVPPATEPQQNSSPLFVSFQSGGPSDSQTDIEQTRVSAAGIQQVSELEQNAFTVKDIRNGVLDASGERGVGDKPVLVKRGRGRPSGKKKAQGRALAVKRARSPDSLVKFSISSSTNSQGAALTSRPLTRGSLGKDFPSEKKRSWKDLEKELEPELEPELEFV
ncbi:MAX gene-associated protein isoform X1 [Cyprinodon tularosa]|uniref:MAX gene-associated protein isoform X1 n=1 Tax=Cyprinodon tularosa TaxID=77115 RepID=UPI0018E25DDB|nr:MAX gene-associated protein isoform X1 [Cyprinodon tularosa]XP_038141999.1 MAX gene-associated protein isoform X1 [Cyprinodon tularosa]XP_038142000.1 MAX gene-associated protein isoform X1 [Cyprinodon tularosa]